MAFVAAVFFYGGVFVRRGLEVRDRGSRDRYRYGFVVRGREVGREEVSVFASFRGF